MNQESNRKEIWEENSIALDDSRDIGRHKNDNSIADIDAISEEINKEELKDQETFFPQGWIEEGDQELGSDAVTMSELDEINPPDSISYNPKFFEAAHEFISVVNVQAGVTKKGRAFTEYLQKSFINVYNASKAEFELLNKSTEQMNTNNAEKVPRSPKFMLFADKLIKLFIDEKTLDRLNNLSKTEAIYQAIFKKFLSKTHSEANYLLKQMRLVVKQADPETEMEQFGEMADSEFYERTNTMYNTHNMTHLLLDINRTRQQDQLLSKEESVLKLFNYSVFKLACIFERVRLYMYDIVQPRDNKLQVIEVNLDTDKNKKFIEGERVINIWEKNDFIMTYQVLQIINNEIKRIEKKNQDRSLFIEQILPFIEREEILAHIRMEMSFKSASFVSDNTTDSLMVPRQQNAYNLLPNVESATTQQERRIMQSFFLQEQSNLGSQAYQINTNRWDQFTSDIRGKKQGNLQTNSIKTINQDVFLLFKLQLKEPTNLPKGVTRTFQLELMYNSGSAISQKVKIKQVVQPGNGLYQEHKFLFLQVPFKLLLGTNIYMIIKVFSSIVSKSITEQDRIWTPQLPQDTKQARNEFKFYEGYTLVNISDAYWKKNLKCGQNFNHPVSFYKPDKVQVVDDRFVQILKERSFVKHQELQSQYMPQVSYALYSSLVAHAQDFSLNQTRIVMAKKFTRKLFESRELDSSQFLKNDPSSLTRSYNNEQRFEIDKQIIWQLQNLNEIKLELHSLLFTEACPIKQSYVRIQIFLRQKDLGCIEQVYGTFDEMAFKTFSYQTFIVPVHQNRAVFKETCFLKLPTKDQSALKDLAIFILVQVPILATDFVHTSDIQGNPITTPILQKELGITKGKIEQETMQSRPDLILFKTEYINEISLYDVNQNSVVQTTNDAKLTFKKFTSRGFTVKQNKPFRLLPDDPCVTLSYGIDVYSIYFTHDPPLNKIITMYDEKQDLNNAEIKEILLQTEKIQPQILMFQPERLLSILLNIFCKTQTPEGSNYAFEAILHVIKFFKSQKSPKDQRVVDDFISKRKNFQASPIYPKILFQMLCFVDHLKQSLQDGKPMGQVKQHFTLFKEMPTIMSFLRKSFELEELNIANRSRLAERNNRKATEKKGSNMADTIREYQEKKNLEAGKSPQQQRNTSEWENNYTRHSHQVELSQYEEMGARAEFTKSVKETSAAINEHDSESVTGAVNIDRKNQPDLARASKTQAVLTNSVIDQINEMPMTHFVEEVGEIMDEVDELMSQREQRRDEARQAGAESGFKTGNELKHPTRRLTIVNNEVVRPERLLYKIQMPREEFSKVIEIILKRICECLHKDINKSCFTLRMIFYKNLCGILEHLVMFLHPQVIVDIFKYLVKPLEALRDKNLKIEYSNNEQSQNLTESYRSYVEQSDSQVRKTIATHGSALVTEKSMVQEKSNVKQLIMPNTRIRVMNYFSQENFWISEIVGQQEVNTNEFVRRIITMGQFLESKAIEKLPNNPYLGRSIADQFALFIRESSGDFTSHKKNATFLQNISPNLKAHSLLYILHQIFKHENRFAQLFDIDRGKAFVAREDDMLEGQNGGYSQEMINTMRVDDEVQEMRRQIAANRAINRQSTLINGLEEDAEHDELLELHDEWKQKDRLDVFREYSDYYMTLLLQIVKQQGDAELPSEITQALEPVREKCQLIIFQLVTLLNRQTLGWFIHKKKQLRSLLQNMIELIVSDSLEFRSPFTLYGGEKKLRVFQKFTSNLFTELVSEKQYSTVLSYKDTYRPILSSLWLIILLIYVQRLRTMPDQLEETMNEDTYREVTWNMFAQFEAFWHKFTQKRRMLVHAEPINEKMVTNKVIDLMQKAIAKEAKSNMYFTCENLIKLLFSYEQEYFKLKTPDKIDMLTQLVSICQILSDHLQKYKEELPQIESDPEFNTSLFKLLQRVNETFCREDKRPEFNQHLNNILLKFKQIERRVLLLKIAEKNQDLLYRGFCQYEQLKIFMNMHLDYTKTIFVNPFQKYKKLLSQIQAKMQAEDEDDSAGLIMENVQNLIQGAQIPVQDQNSIAKNPNAHLKTEIAFSYVKEHELIEEIVLRDRQSLGSGNTQLNVRVQAMQDACNQLRQNRFFLMAIELKEKEKNLLIQSFQYGETIERDEDTPSSASILPGQNQMVIKTNTSKHNVFATLNEEKTIHQDIQRFRTSAKMFCCYFYVRFFGTGLPLELKRKEGFVLRGLASQSTFQLMEDLEALYGSKVSFVNDDEPMPNPDGPMKIRLEKVEPFTLSKRKRFRIADKEKKISPTLTNNRQRYPPEFKEYFKQNFKKQFYKTRRQINNQLKLSFSRHAESLLPKAFELEAGDEMNKDQTLKHYVELHKSVFDKDISKEEQEKFWAKLKRSGTVNKDERILTEDILKANVEEWTNLTIMLQDLEVSVFEVEETFPTMYNMQMVTKTLTSRIAGVEQEQINWQKRINKNIKVRGAVQNIFSLTQKPDDADEERLNQYYSKVGPKLRNLWDEIRMDIDTDQNGGVLMTLEVFFPNKESLQRLSKENEEKFRKYLSLFVTIEAWFMQIQTSLLLFEEKNKIYDEYQRIMNPHDKLVMDNSINWFSKFTHKRAIFEKTRKKCDIDEALREEEEAMHMEIEDSD